MDTTVRDNAKSKELLTKNKKKKKTKKQNPGNPGNNEKTKLRDNRYRRE